MNITIRMFRISFIPHLVNKTFIISPSNNKFFIAEGCPELYIFKILVQRQNKISNTYLKGSGRWPHHGASIVLPEIITDRNYLWEKPGVLYNVLNNVSRQHLFSEFQIFLKLYAALSSKTRKVGHNFRSGYRRWGIVYLFIYHSNHVRPKSQQSLECQYQHSPQVNRIGDWRGRTGSNKLFFRIRCTHWIPKSMVYFGSCTKRRLKKEFRLLKTMNFIDLFQTI